jgi:hypothetical protein
MEIFKIEEIIFGEEYNVVPNILILVSILYHKV